MLFVSNVASFSTLAGNMHPSAHDVAALLSSTCVGNVRTGLPQKVVPASTTASMTGLTILCLLLCRSLPLRRHLRRNRSCSVCQLWSLQLGILSSAGSLTHLIHGALVRFVASVLWLETSSCRFLAVMSSIGHASPLGCRHTILARSVVGGHLQQLKRGPRGRRIGWKVWFRKTTMITTRKWSQRILKKTEFFRGGTFRK
mmetsp:Transcript_103641/g.206051  ORF Transcript_103641/g.206051 Transcript_103641/m.206051 type:complete len:200 (-) Transcript_103641:291-890(-)